MLYVIIPDVVSVPQIAFRTKRKYFVNFFNIPIRIIIKYIDLKIDRRFLPVRDWLPRYRMSMDTSVAENTLSCPCGHNSNK